MTPPLRREILSPTHTHALRILASGLGAGLIGTGLILGLRAHEVTALPPPTTLTATESIHVSVGIPASVELSEPRGLPSRSEVSLVFHAGGSAYMKLADLSGDEAEVMPRHGAATLTRDEYAHVAIAPVLVEDVPLAYRDWQDRAVIVDGTCRTRVAGFGVVARLIGDPGYTGEDLDDWTESAVLEHGAPVLAARLEGCVGAGSVARDASGPPVVVPDVTEDLGLADAGRALVLASQDAQQASREWAELGEPGTWHDSPDTEWVTYVVRHPTTGARYLSVEATHMIDCGGPEIHIWHLYRIGPAGELERVEVSAGELTSIDQLIDIDGDGTFEVLGRPWRGGETHLVGADGETITKLELPFYGCRC